VGTAAPKDEHGTIRLETQNVPAFLIEDYMPPENELKMRVDFSYSEDALEQDQAKFWKKEGKKLDGRVEGFIGKKKALEQVVAQTVAASDTPEAKLRKLTRGRSRCVIRHLRWKNRNRSRSARREGDQQCGGFAEGWARERAPTHE